MRREIPTNKIAIIQISHLVGNFNLVSRMTETNDAINTGTAELFISQVTSLAQAFECIRMFLD